MKLAIFGLLMTVCPLLSQTVSVSAVDGFTGRFLTSTGTALPFGSLVRVGSFDLSGANLATIQTSSDFQLLDALFTPLAEGITDSGTIDQASTTGSTLIVNDFGSSGSGNTFGQITGTAASYIAPDTTLYFWILNSSDTASATEWAIAGSTSDFFEIPTEPATTTLTARDADIILRGSKVGDDLLLGPVDIIPEPSTALAASLGCLLLLGRRRRQMEW